MTSAGAPGGSNSITKPKRKFQVEKPTNSTSEERQAEMNTASAGSTSSAPSTANASRSSSLGGVGVSRTKTAGGRSGPEGEAMGRNNLQVPSSSSAASSTQKARPPPSSRSEAAQATFDSRVTENYYDKFQGEEAVESQPLHTFLSDELRGNNVGSKFSSSQQQQLLQHQAAPGPDLPTTFIGPNMLPLRIVGGVSPKLQMSTTRRSSSSASNSPSKVLVSQHSHISAFHLQKESAILSIENNLMPRRSTRGGSFNTSGDQRGYYMDDASYRADSSPSSKLQLPAKRMSIHEELQSVASSHPNSPTRRRAVSQSSGGGRSGTQSASQSPKREPNFIKKATEAWRHRLLAAEAEEPKYYHEDLKLKTRNMSFDNNSMIRPSLLREPERRSSAMADIRARVKRKKLHDEALIAQMGGRGSFMPLFPGDNYANDRSSSPPPGAGVDDLAARGGGTGITSTRGAASTSSRSPTTTGVGVQPLSADNRVGLNSSTNVLLPSESDATIAEQMRQYQQVLENNKLNLQLQSQQQQVAGVVQRGQQQQVLLQQQPPVIFPNSARSTYSSSGIYSSRTPAGTTGGGTRGVSVGAVPAARSLNTSSVVDSSLLQASYDHASKYYTPTAASSARARSGGRVGSNATGMRNSGARASSNMEQVLLQALDQDPAVAASFLREAQGNSSSTTPLDQKKLNLIQAQMAKNQGTQKFRQALQGILRNRFQLVVRRFYQFSSRFANANWTQLQTFINQQNEELTVTKSLRNNDLILFDQSKSQLLRQIFLLTFIKNIMQYARRNSFAYAFLERLKWNNFLLKKTSKLQTENLKLQHKLKKERTTVDNYLSQVDQIDSKINSYLAQDEMRSTFAHKFVFLLDKVLMRNKNAMVSFAFERLSLNNNFFPEATKAMRSRTAMLNSNNTARGAGAASSFMTATTSGAGAGGAVPSRATSPPPNIFERTGSTSPPSRYSSSAKQITTNHQQQFQSKYQQLEIQAANLMKIRLKYCVRSDFQVFGKDFQTTVAEVTAAGGGTITIGTTETNKDHSNQSGSAATSRGKTNSSSAGGGALTWNMRLTIGCLEMLMYVLTTLLKSKLRFGVNQLLKNAVSGGIGAPGSTMMMMSNTTSRREVMNHAGQQQYGDEFEMLEEELLEDVTSAAEMKNKNHHRKNLSPTTSPPGRSRSPAIKMRAQGNSGIASTQLGTLTPGKKELQPPPGLQIEKLALHVGASKTNEEIEMSENLNLVRNSMNFRNSFDGVHVPPAEVLNSTSNPNFFPAAQQDTSLPFFEDLRSPPVQHREMNKTAATITAVTSPPGQTQTNSYRRQYEQKRGAALAKLSPTRVLNRNSPTSPGKIEITDGDFGYGRPSAAANEGVVDDADEIIEEEFLMEESTLEPELQAKFAALRNAGNNTVTKPGTATASGPATVGSGSLGRIQIKPPSRESSTASAAEVAELLEKVAETNEGVLLEDKETATANKGKGGTASNKTKSGTTSSRGGIAALINPFKGGSTSTTSSRSATGLKNPSKLFAALPRKRKYADVHKKKEELKEKKKQQEANASSSNAPVISSLSKRDQNELDGGAGPNHAEGGDQPSEISVINGERARSRASTAGGNSNTSSASFMFYGEKPEGDASAILSGTNMHHHGNTNKRRVLSPAPTRVGAFAVSNFLLQKEREKVAGVVLAAKNASASSPVGKTSRTMTISGQRGDEIKGVVSSSASNQVQGENAKQIMRKFWQKFDAGQDLAGEDDDEEDDLSQKPLKNTRTTAQPELSQRTKNQQRSDEAKQHSSSTKPEPPKVVARKQDRVKTHTASGSTTRSADEKGRPDGGPSSSAAGAVAHLEVVPPAGADFLSDEDEEDLSQEIRFKNRLGWRYDHAFSEGDDEEIEVEDEIEL
ncbi:unnamed protein product [Amoebophrya sp. A120]|nr:unnamed protein product [Amoebophrya sp. A120]|eukprot:GSA120T00020731001.1